MSEWGLSEEKGRNKKHGLIRHTSKIDGLQVVASIEIVNHVLGDDTRVLCIQFFQGVSVATSYDTDQDHV